MNAKDIKKQIEKKGGLQTYKPKVLDESVIEIDKGTPYRARVMPVGVSASGTYRLWRMIYCDDSHFPLETPVQRVGRRIAELEKATEFSATSS